MKTILIKIYFKIFKFNDAVLNFEIIYSDDVTILIIYMVIEFYILNYLHCTARVPIISDLYGTTWKGCIFVYIM